MITIEETVTSKVFKYVACDGTKFNNEDQCRKYEETHEAAVRAHYNNHVVGRTDGWDLFKGSEDNTIDIVSVNEESFNAILQMFYTVLKVKELSPEIVSGVENSMGSYLLIGWNYDKDYCWIIGNTNDICKNITDKINKITHEGK